MPALVAGTSNSPIAGCDRCPPMFEADTPASSRIPFNRVENRCALALVAALEVE